MDASYEFRARDGRLVRVRPVRPEDSPLLVEVFDNLSPQSRYLRFNRALAAPDPARVEHVAQELATWEETRGAAWLALVETATGLLPVAVARYSLIPPAMAEAAIAVRDDFQHLGIGSHLLFYLAAQAQAAGIRKLTALVRADNHVLLRVLGHAPYPLARVEQGEYVYFEADLTAIPATVRD